MKNIQHLGLITGMLVLIVFLFMPNPTAMNTQAKHVTGVTLLMTIWWVTDAIPVYITAFIPLALFPLLGILPASDIALNYGNDLILLLLAGLMMAKSIEKQNLHKRIALTTIHLLGTSRQKVIWSETIVLRWLRFIQGARWASLEKMEI